jgi:hypothetical protein
MLLENLLGNELVKLPKRSESAPYWLNATVCLLGYRGCFSVGDAHGQNVIAFFLEVEPHNFEERFALVKPILSVLWRVQLVDHQFKSNGL